MGQEGEQQQHENATHPDEEIQRHFGIVDLFLVHAPRYPQVAAGHIRYAR